MKNQLNPVERATIIAYKLNEMIEFLDLDVKEANWQQLSIAYQETLNQAEKFIEQAKNGSDSARKQQKPKDNSGDVVSPPTKEVSHKSGKPKTDKGWLDGRAMKKETN